MTCEGVSFSIKHNFLQMDNVSNRSVIRYLGLKGLTPKEVHEDMVATVGSEAPSYSTVKKWSAEFKRGRESLEDDHRSGRPVTATTEESIEKIHQMILADRRVTERQIAFELTISQERVHNIIRDELGMSKVSARWVPKLLTPDHKRTRLLTSRDNLALFEQNPDGFLQRFVTMDETWVHHYQPESKEQSKQWKRPGSPTPRKAKIVRSAGKIMASIFWDAKGVLLLDFLESGKTITGVYYAQLLHQLRENIKTKRRGMLTKGVVFHHDNAPAHTSAVAMSAIQSCGFEILPHPPYSPDLAPSDFHLFPKMKLELSGRRFTSNGDVIEAVEEFLESKDSTFYEQGIRALQHRWTKCVDCRGDYVEK